MIWPEVSKRNGGNHTVRRRLFVTQSRYHGIGVLRGDILRGFDSSSICAAGEEFGEYPACPYRSQIVDGGSPCCLIVQSDKDRRYFYKAFKQQQHQRKQPGGQDIHDS